MTENNLPESWELVKLVDELNFIPTGVTDFKETKKYYSTGSIQDNLFTPEGEFTFANRPSRANRVGELGDVLQARMKATDKGILVDEKLDGQLFSTGFLQVRPFSNTYHNKLLYYFIKSDLFLSQKNDLATGSTQEALTDNGASEIEIPLPPLAEQHRLVVKLDAVMQKVESNKQRLDKIPKLLKRFRQSVLAAAVNNNGAEEITRNVCEEIQIGPFGTQLHRHEYISNGIPLINPTHIQGGEIVPDLDLTITKEKFKELPNYHLKTGDVIMGRRGEMARCALIGKKENGWLCGTGSLFFRPNLKKINSQYLYWVLSNSNTKAYLEGEAKGSTMSNLNLNIVRNIPLPLPSLEEQIKIVKQVENLFAFADKIEARYTKAKTMLDKLPQSILAKAFRGELVAQDPNDEPASVLLARIKIEKEKHTAERKGKKSKEYSIEEKPLKIAAEGKVKYKKTKV
jgi:type I restriction enzyme, S subunit